VHLLYIVHIADMDVKTQQTFLRDQRHRVIQSQLQIWCGSSPRELIDLVLDFIAFPRYVSIDEMYEYDKNTAIELWGGRGERVTYIECLDFEHRVQRILPTRNPTSSYWISNLDTRINILITNYTKYTHKLGYIIIPDSQIVVGLLDAENCSIYNLPIRI